MSDCKSCPSYVPADRVAIEMKAKNIGAPMCKQFGYVLGRASHDEDTAQAVLEHFASDCERFGQPKPATPPTSVEMRSRITTTDTAAIEANGGNPSVLKTCRECVNNVTDVAVSVDLNFNADLCRATGKLITSIRSACVECPFSASKFEFSIDAAGTTQGLDLMPHYKTGFRMPLEQAIKKYITNARTDVEPTEYNTDKPVTTEEIEDGIRAWRKVTDPDGSGNSVFLPIFDNSIFSKEEIALIPQAGDDTHPELYVDYAGLLYAFAADSYELDETLALQGEPGLGKTEFARWIAYLMQLPFRRFSFTESSEIDDVIGKMVFEDGETQFHKGRVVDAYERPGILVADELNAAPDPIRQAFRPLFDNNKQLVLDQGKGEVVSRNAFCFFIIAQNPSWDHRNSGLFEAADADYNRLSVVEVPQPPEAVERHIITERCKLDGYAIDHDTLTAIMKIAVDIREASSQGSIPFTWGMRQQIKVARKTRMYALPQAYRRAAIDFYEPAVRELVMQIIASHTEG